MITIYLDWNLYSILKNPKQKTHLILDDFLKQNTDKINLVYSDAHLNDLNQTHKNKYLHLQNDLKYLAEKTNNVCIVNYWGSTTVKIESRDVIEFFDSIVEHNKDFTIIRKFLKIFLNKIGFIRDNIIRRHIKKNLKIDVREICNFKKQQLDDMIRKAKLSDSLNNFLTYGTTLRTSKYDKLSFIDYYSTAYTSLDLISYFPDNLKEKGNFENLKNDALHSAYGATCDIFITNDNKCYHKSKFLFVFFKSKSKLLKTCKVKNTERFKEELFSLIK